MLFIAGSAANAAKQSALTTKFEQKKSNGFTFNKFSASENNAMSAEETQFDMFRKQLEESQKANTDEAIANKVKSGKKLTNDEIQYLEKNNPAILEEYKETQAENEAYKRELRHCKTKEEVAQLNVNKINGYLTIAKDISNNPHIPDGQKAAELAKIVAKTNMMRETMNEFVKTDQYRDMPEDKRELDEREEAAKELREGRIEKSDAQEKPDKAADKESEETDDEKTSVGEPDNNDHNAEKAGTEKTVNASNDAHEHTAEDELKARKPKSKHAAERTKIFDSAVNTLSGYISVIQNNSTDIVDSGTINDSV